MARSLFVSDNKKSNVSYKEIYITFYVKSQLLVSSRYYFKASNINTRSYEIFRK